MGMKNKLKSVFNKLRRKGKNAADAAADIVRDRTDSEISAEEVVTEEIFPEGKRKVKKRVDAETSDDCARRNCKSERGEKVCGKAPVKPACRKNRTRPTNGGYEMIDIDDDTCDSSKS